MPHLLPALFFFGMKMTGVPKTSLLISDFFSLTTPSPRPPPRQTPPRPSHPRGLDFGPFQLRLAPFRLRFSSVWLRFGSVSGLFRVHFGVLGGVGAGSGRGASVREKNITTFDFCSFRTVLGI